MLGSGSHHFRLNVIDQNAVAEPPPGCTEGYFLFLLAVCQGGKGNRIWQVCNVLSATNETNKRMWLDNQNPSLQFTIIGEKRVKGMLLVVKGQDLFLIALFVIHEDG